MYGSLSHHRYQDWLEEAEMMSTPGYQGLPCEKRRYATLHKGLAAISAERLEPANVWLYRLRAVTTAMHPVSATFPSLDTTARTCSLEEERFILAHVSVYGRLAGCMTQTGSQRGLAEEKVLGPWQTGSRGWGKEGAGEGGILPATPPVTCLRPSPAF